VIIVDTDHLWGIGGDRVWAWKSFTRGLNPIFMDQYDDSYKLDGGGYDMHNANDVSLRLNLGYTLAFANRMNLAAMTPRPDLCSTEYCLANPTADGAEYLVYLPSGATATGILQTAGVDSKHPSFYLPPDSLVWVDLSAISGELSVEWFNPDTGDTVSGGSVKGGANRLFVAPFSGDAVLYLHQ
jgi:hypothetical protein